MQIFNGIIGDLIKRVRTRINRVRRHFRKKKDSKPHFFKNSSVPNYEPFFRLDKNVHNIYNPESKITGNAETLMRSRFETGNKKRKKSKVSEL